VVSCIEAKWFLILLFLEQQLSIYHGSLFRVLIDIRKLARYYCG
jgi:hypothetical protein